MSLTLLCAADDLRGQKALIAARYAGVEIAMGEFAETDVKTPAFLAKCPNGKPPVLETAEGPVYGPNAICRYIARSTENTLYGSSAYESALIDQWIEFAATEIDLPSMAWVLPIIGVIPNNQTATSKAKGDIRVALKILNGHLMTRTFMVGERITLADIIIACSLLNLYKLVLDRGFRREFVHTNRWFMTCVNQLNFKEVLGEVVLCEKMQVAPDAPAPAEKPTAEKPAATEKPAAADKPKKKKKKDEEDDDEEEEDPALLEEPKGKNPLDALPPSKMDMDSWKRVYSNEDTRTVAIPWLWEHLDEGYCLYFCKYKYEVETDQLFVVCNQVSGFIQRLDKLRKYGFGSLCIFNEAKPFEIEGCWIFRGPDIPAEMRECDDFVLYEWNKVDLTNPAQKDLFCDMLAWDGNFGGKKFNQAKNFK